MNNKLKHTPGPWFFIEDGGFVLNTKGLNGDIICQTWGRDEIDFENHENNARLIAAAPEMLNIIISHIKSDRLDLELYKNSFVKIVEKATGMSIEDVLDE